MRHPLIRSAMQGVAQGHAAVGAVRGAESGGTAGAGMRWGGWTIAVSGFM